MITQLEYRKLNGLSSDVLSVVLPKRYTTVLGFEKGNYVKCMMDGCRIIIEAADAKKSEEPAKQASDEGAQNHGRCK